MRILILLGIVSIGFSSPLFSQTTKFDDDGTIRSDNYEFIRPARIIKCTNSDGLVTTGDTIPVPRGWKFQLVDMLGDGSAVIEFWQFRSPKNHKLYNYVYFKDSTGKTDSTKAFFIVRAKEWQDKVVKVYSTGFFPKYKGDPWFGGTTITGGMIVLPYKFRPALQMNGQKSGFDFSKDITLGVSGGLKQRISHYQPFYLDLLGNVGISDVSQTPFNTNKGVSTPTDVPALTFSWGFVLDFKSIQLGAFMGWDRVSDSNLNGWIYQGKPWFSIGFGYSIFSVSTAKTNAPGAQN